MDEEQERRLNKLEEKMEKRLNQPWGKPENNLTSHLKVLKTYFHDEYGEALSKTDSKAISFFVQYLENSLLGTRYTEWRPEREKLEKLKKSVSKLISESETNVLTDEEQQIVQTGLMKRSSSVMKGEKESNQVVEHER